MAAASVRLDQPVHPAHEEILQRALVIGGGLAGMMAAVSLADMGYGVDLVERTGRLGGNLSQVKTLLDWEAGQLADGKTQKPADKPIGLPTSQSTNLVWRDPQAFLQRLVERVESSERIHVYKEAQVETVSGWAGQFQTAAGSIHDESNNGNQWEETLHHGAIIVATGGHEVTSTEYLHGQDPRVVTQRELETRLVEGGEVPSDVVMIQCVGSREPERPYCSRVCCAKAVTNALKIKERDPQANVFVLYREMRTYGFREDYYREARDQGVVFLRYELPDKPQVSVDRDGLVIRLKEPITGEEVSIGAGMLVLSTGIEPNDNPALAEILNVPLDANGFFQEEYPKMRPLDFVRRGIFVCGLAHSPRSTGETIVQAQGAAMRAAALLAQRQLVGSASAVEVTPYFCAACGQCVEVCPFGARVLEPGASYAEVIEVLCQGCGACVVACPNKTSQPYSQTPAQIMAVEDVIAG